MIKWKIEKLGKGHNRGLFTCGEADLDDFLKTLASQYAKKNVGQTFVATREDEPGRVFGFYTVSTGAFAIESIPESVRKKLPRHPIPTIHLGRLGVDKSVQGTGLGRTLLFHFLYKSAQIAQQIGVCAVDVFAKNESGRKFYEKYGFRKLEDNPSHLYLPIVTVEQMFGRE